MANMSGTSSRADIRDDGGKQFQGKTSGAWTYADAFNYESEATSKIVTAADRKQQQALEAQKVLEAKKALDESVRVIDSSWRKSGFDNVSILTVTIKNGSRHTIGNFRYHTVYSPTVPSITVLRLGFPHLTEPPA